MSNVNDEKHISDKASSVDLEPGTVFPVEVTDLQAAMALIGEHALKNKLPVATESIQGVLAVATNDAIDLGTSDDLIVTPLKLKYAMSKPQATESVYGTTRYATTAEALSGTVSDASVSPSALDYVFANRKATVSKAGALKVATESIARGGVDDETIMTPLKTKLAIAEFSESYGTATESANGVVRLATTAQTLAGTLREGYAISPYSFSRAFGTETQTGVFKIATTAIAQGLTDNQTVITPKRLGEVKATTVSMGIVKLTKTKGVQANTALASDADVLPLSGGDLTGPLTQNGSPFITKQFIDLIVPIGMGVPMFYEMPDNEYMLRGDGRAVSKIDYPELFAVYGYRYGGSGNLFNLPDTRGLIIRGADEGRMMDAWGGRGVGSFQPCAVQRHKHMSAWGESDDYSPFGRTNQKGFQGSARTDWDNFMYMTNDGTNFYSVVNANDVISTETRPHNLSARYMIRVK